MRVEVTAAAKADTKKAVTWWRENRPAAPSLFERELHDGLQLIVRSPGVGMLYRERASHRRLLLPKTRYHIYFRVDEAAGVIYIARVWHGQRGRGPTLKGA